jgi:hypothetical protein
MKSLRASIVVAASVSTLFLSGCILPARHVNRRSDQIEGRVIDGITKAPIQGAQIHVDNRSRIEISTVTDRDGRFVLKSAYSFVPFIFIGGHAPIVNPHSGIVAPILQIAHEQYYERRIDASNLSGVAHPASDSILLPDIELVSK